MLFSEEVSHHSLWWLAQQEGEKIVGKEEEEWRAVFKKGEMLEGDEKEREIVVAEVDGTHLKAEARGSQSFPGWRTSRQSA